MLNESLYSSNKMDWETPQFLFDRLHAEFGFTLDVCATDENAKCKRFYTTETDGLAQDWCGIAWMNPPYGREIAKWVKKAYESSQEGCVCVCLVPVRSDTRWWHEYVMRSAEIRLLSKRLSFEGSSNKAPFPVAIVVFDSSKGSKPKLVSMTI